MGNSGGAWLMRSCTMHEKILMIAEINQVLRLKFVPKEKVYPPNINIDFDMKIAQRGFNKIGTVLDSRTQCDIAVSFLIEQFRIRKEEVIGLIKCIDPQAIIKCKRYCDSVKVYQTLRNPVGIINFYTSEKTLRQIAFDASEEECFKEHVTFFSGRFAAMIKQRDDVHYEIIKLEDINKSLKNKTSFFKNKMEEIFEVEWSDDLISQIIQKENYGDDGSISKEIWDNWKPWKKEYFLKSFKSIMCDLGYMSIID